MLEYRIDLRARNARKPLEEIHDRGAAFEVLEEGADGNAGAAEQPFATDLSGDALNSGTQAPVEHTEVYSEAVPRGQRSRANTVQLRCLEVVPSRQSCGDGSVPLTEQQCCRARPCRNVRVPMQVVTEGTISDTH